jgi:probable HAF family extracellular repeat protein
LFDDGVMTDLGTLPGGDSSSATGINDRGQVVGFSNTASADTHAFLFENGAMVDLGTLPGGRSSRAFGINNRGQVVGSSSSATSPFNHAALWTPNHGQSDHDEGEDQGDHNECGHQSDHNEGGHQRD